MLAQFSLLDERARNNKGVLQTFSLPERTDRGAAYLEFCRKFNGTSDDNSDRNDTEGWRRLREFAYVSSGGRIVLW